MEEPQHPHPHVKQLSEVGSVGIELLGTSGMHMNHLAKNPPGAKTFHMMP